MLSGQIYCGGALGSKAIRPPGLKPGSRIGLVAPAGPILERDDIRRAVERCQALGYQAVVGGNAHAKYGYLAGTDPERQADLNSALSDPSLDAIWCLRGGYGTPRLLPRVAYSAVAQKPKIVIGFSDITALLHALVRQAGIVTFHGPVAREPLSAFSRDAMMRVITGTDAAGVMPPAPASDDALIGTDGRIVTLRGGRAEGPLFGGNLTMMCHLVGTPYLPTLDGALLFLEEVSEDLYDIDRSLVYLRNAGILEHLAGIIIGRFTDMTRATPSGALGFEEVLETHLGTLGIPVAFGFPIGHVPDQWTLPLGVTARLDADAGSVELLEPAVT
jgi:muramoyltetrapeptide carboxypeptidase